MSGEPPQGRALRNPILPGFNPDPSICRAGDDYYLVTSTFEYFPGLPVYHSRDLANWHLIGHVLDRPSQLDLDGIRASAGLYAPTIRYRQSTFYVINTLVDGKTRSGNFIVTASEPGGPWSEPNWLEGADGFDPSLFFDEDGRTWYTGTHLVEEGHYKGHTDVWVQEIDLAAMKLIGERVDVWDGALKGAIWAEAPHIYRVGDWYYLMIAEGGTAHHHAVTVARSRAITGPYEGNPANPILTHRHLGLDYPIVGAGHGDLVETQNGEWWMALLAMRPYGGYFYNLGRETFLAPVRWEDGWPVASPGSGRVESRYPAPDLPEQQWPAPAACDDFDAGKLGPQWYFLRTPREAFWSLSERPGFLRLTLRPERIAEQASPSFVGRRQQHIHFRATTALEFSPGAEHECAGLALIQNNQFYFEFALYGGATPTLRLTRREGGVETVVAEVPARGGRLELKVEAHEQDYSFYLALEADQWSVVAEHVDGRILSTPVAGGFVGTTIAMVASSNGRPGGRAADFDWFEYVGLDQD